jgi:Protein of unknown function (DUF1570)
MLRFCCLVLTSAWLGNVWAVQLSPCQGHFGAVRGPAYSFSLDSPGTVIQPQQELEIAQAARAIYDSWGDLLSAAPPFVVEVNVSLVSDPVQFNAMKQQLAPDLPDVTGFYSGANNQAVALYEPGDPRQSRRRALHEISHLITTTQTGPAPYWIAEGLAEFYEMIEPREEGLAVVPNDRHLRWLSRNDAPPLAEFFAVDADGWHRSDSQGHYSVAWSLVYFLMSSAEGRGALGQTLQQASTHSCSSYSAAAFLGQAWPGGIEDLEPRWRAWLRQGRFQPLNIGFSAT